MLNMGWSDGVSYVPVDFRMAASNNDGCLLEGSHVKGDNRTVATRRRKQARTPKPELALQMLENVKGMPVQTQHVLFDSWFSPPKAILGIKQLGYDVVARIKSHENYRYLYNGQALSINQIYKANKKRSGKSRCLLSVDVEIAERRLPFQPVVAPTLEEQLTTAIARKNIPRVKLEADENGYAIVDKDKHPEIYNWAVNG
jgi:hypothetical protein